MAKGAVPGEGKLKSDVMKDDPNRGKAAQPIQLGYVVGELEPRSLCWDLYWANQPASRLRRHEYRPLLPQAASI
jgi:hypothetical protein